MRKLLSIILLSTLSFWSVGDGAIRLTTASSQWLSRASDMLDYNSAYTVSIWVYRITDPNDYQTVFNTAISAGFTNNADLVGCTGDGTTLTGQVFNANLGGEVFGPTLTANTWYCIWIVRESTTSFKVYLNGVLEITNTQTVVGRGAITAFDIGRSNINTFQGEYWGGRIAGLKIWTAALSADELALEDDTYRPKRFANLYMWCPFLKTGDAVDYGGTVRSWTENATPTTEDGPNISW